MLPSLASNNLYHLFATPNPAQYHHPHNSRNSRKANTITLDTISDLSPLSDNFRFEYYDLKKRNVSGRRSDKKLPPL